MNPARTSRFLQALLSALPLLFFVAPVAAVRDPFAKVPSSALNGYQGGPNDVWKESRVVIPPYPKAGDLVPLPPGPRDTLRVFVDASSVSRAPDDVVRLTLVVVSSGGARNVFFDGIRCATKEYKTYAFGTDAKTMEPMKDARWRPIPRFPTNAFRYQLYHNYVCDDALVPRNPADFLHKLKYGN